MKVFHLINTLSAGGAELHLLTLCRHLKRQGVDIVVACMKEQVKGSPPLRSEFEREGIRVIHLVANSKWDWGFIGRFMRVIREEKPDVLHTHLPRADLVGAIGRALYSSIRWVCSVHGIYSAHWSGKRILPLFSLVWRRADTQVAISKAVKDWLVKERHIPPERVAVIHYGIDMEPFVHPDSNLRHPLRLDGRALLGSMGRLEPVKGHESLIQAMPAILKQVPNASLIIAGHDAAGYGKVLQAMIDERKLNGQVQLVGFQRDVPSFLHALDVFALASRSEGFGQVVVEAMAAGKPVVASRIPSLTEIIVDGETGLLAEPDNPKAFAHAIASLLSNPEERGRMGRRGQERVRHRFSADRMAAETVSLYRTLINPNA